MTIDLDTAKKLDLKGLIYESYQMEGLTREECRSIFFDWSMGSDAAAGTPGAVKALLEIYGPAYPDHLMTEVLKEGLPAANAPRRRGGWRAKRQ